MKADLTRNRGRISGLLIYVPFAKNVIKDNLAYKVSFYLTLICKILSVFVTYYLWKAIFNSSDTGRMMGGFTKEEMVIYVFMSFICSNIISISMASKIGNDVMDGSIAMSLIKPINYKMKLLFESIGEMIFKLFFPSIFVWVGVEIYKKVTFANSYFSIKNTIFFGICSLEGFLICFLFEFCFGMLAFYSTYIWGMEIIKNGILLFLTGQLIPFTFYPVMIKWILNFLPFASMNYVPVMIYLGKLDDIQIIKILCHELAWIVFLELLGIYLWKRVTKRISILGG